MIVSMMENLKPPEEESKLTLCVTFRLIVTFYVVITLTGKFFKSKAEFFHL